VSGELVWRLRNPDPDIASVRYRCLIPARHLAAQGVASRLSWGRHDPTGGLPSAIVFVKTFERDDLKRAQQAASLGIPVLLDVCDNVYAPGYERPAAPELEVFERMAALATGIVTTGPALRDALAARVEGPFHVVPDPLETPADVRHTSRAMARAGLARLSPGGLVRSARRRRRAAPPPHGERRVIWFGNTGSTRPRFGIVNLVDVAGELERAAAATPFRLLVVSGSPELARRQTASLSIETDHVKWDRLSIFDDLRSSDVAVFPNSRDEFSICKSANRAVLALSNGVPVVATRIPSLDPLEGCLVFDDFERGVSAYLEDAALGAGHVERAREAIERSFGAQTVARLWKQVLDGLSGSRR
jgi:glycosyltransferase involved in cell wall biosynthesis